MTYSATPSQPEIKTRSRWTRHHFLALASENGFILFFILWCLFLSLSTDTFLTPKNLINVLRQASIMSILAIGEMLVVLTGMMDVSLAMLLGLCGVLASGLLVSGVPPLLAALLGIGFGGFIGLVNALIVTRLKINAIVATLGMMTMLEGVTLLLLHGESIAGSPLVAIDFLSSATVGPLPMPIVIMLALYALFHVVLGRTVWGAQLYATGSNERATWLSGVPVGRVRGAAFVLAGLLAGVGGLMQVARLGAATASMGRDLLFPMLTAVVLSGVSLTGGRGRVLNVLIAAIFLVTITNGMILLGVPTEWQNIVSGAIMILALSLDRFRASAGG